MNEKSVGFSFNGFVYKIPMPVQQKFVNIFYFNGENHSRDWSILPNVINGLDEFFDGEFSLIKI